MCRTCEAITKLWSKFFMHMVELMRIQTLHKFNHHSIFQITDDAALHAPQHEKRAEARHHIGFNGSTGNRDVDNFARISPSIRQHDLRLFFCWLNAQMAPRGNASGRTIVNQGLHALLQTFKPCTSEREINGETTFYSWPNS